ncbi:diguanylate cyclase (GGDEF) domain-containing protein [Alkalispirochaeta americana]|uniref:diguanylate cyclase n=1 Tax=Alkalispirochaeta americana TaxID=159291 RepID=A0A1N6T4M9_9SPIO|nr:diguanylate cyclase [Alkalispirochaeta americana]SIQ48355.1 diguanylate cyclase (GGDEF) domain-containing protein [Alkalispirochaeta americana]
MMRGPGDFCRNFFPFISLLLGALFLVLCLTLSGWSFRARPLAEYRSGQGGGVFLFPEEASVAPFLLTGEWAVMPGEYRPPGTHPPDPADQRLLNVPPPRGRFYLPSGDRYISGPITYRAVLRQIPREGLSGITIPFVQGGLQVWGNGRLLFSTASLGPSPGVRPGMARGLGFFLGAPGASFRMERSLLIPLLPDQAGDLDLVLAFDNIFQPYGGFTLAAPVAGDLGSLQRIRSARIFRDGFLTGALLLVGVFHLLLFPASRRDWSHPCFSLVCVTAALFLGTLQGEMVLATLGMLKGLLLVHLQGVLLFGFPLLYLVFLQRLFPRELTLREVRWPLAGLMILLGASLVAPLRWKLDLAVLGIPWATWGAVVLVRTLWRARRIPRGGSSLIAGGVMVWTLFGLFDGLHLLRGSQPLLWLSQYGTVLFVLANSLALSWRVVDYRLSLALLQDEAHHDGLTELWNRRNLDLHLREEWGQHLRKGASLAVVIVDIDHFKRYNDTLGHQAGDRALKEVSRLLRDEASRRKDYLARYGGEEFVLLLPDTTSEGAYQVALRACERVRAAEIPHPQGIGGVLTISLGVAATIPGNKEDEAGPGHLLFQADQALYRAKKRGRNTVEAGGPLATPREERYSRWIAHEN